MKATTAIVERIEHRILMIRGHKIMIDADLAGLYGVSTGRFNEAVRRIPHDFMYQLTDAEHAALRSQIAISNTGRGGRRYAPCAFTEHGAIMGQPS